MAELTHLDAEGRARMVDVGEKPSTTRRAVAEGRIVMKAETLNLIAEGGHKKGDVLAVARVATVDPDTLQVQQRVDYQGNEFFRLGTVAIEVDDEVWVGGIRGSLGIARFPQ